MIIFLKVFFTASTIAVLSSFMITLRSSKLVTQKLQWHSRDKIHFGLRKILMKHDIHTNDGVKLIPTKLINLKDHESNRINDGPKFYRDEYITYNYIDNLMTHLKEEKLIPKNDVVRILMAAYMHHRSLPNIHKINIPIDGKVCVVGDTHGQYYDLLNILKLIKFPLPSPGNDNDNSSSNSDSDSDRKDINTATNISIVFNGDLVDRGHYSFEVAISLIALSVLYPNNIFLIRGNHETLQMNFQYGFFDELLRKYDDEVYDLFIHVFNAFPLAGLIANKVFVAHGGIAHPDISLADIEKLDRFVAEVTDPVMNALLWSDPSRLKGITRGSRGGGTFKFGPDVTETFLHRHNLELLVRSHEVRHRGHSTEHEGKCRTVFSAPNYMNECGNLGAFLTFNSTSDFTSPVVTEFKAVPNPDYERRKVIVDL